MESHRSGQGPTIAQEREPALSIECYTRPDYYSCQYLYSTQDLSRWRLVQSFLVHLLFKLECTVLYCYLYVLSVWTATSTNKGGALTTRSSEIHNVSDLFTAQFTPFLNFKILIINEWTRSFVAGRYAPLHTHISSITVLDLNSSLSNYNSTGKALSAHGQLMALKDLPRFAKLQKSCRRSRIDITETTP